MIFIRYHLNFSIVVIALFRKWSNSDRGWLVVVGDMDGKLKTHGSESGPLSIIFKAPVGRTFVIDRRGTFFLIITITIVTGHLGSTRLTTVQ